MCMQVPPHEAIQQLLEDGDALSAEAAVQSQALWSRADAYYYRNVARVQRLWQVRLPCSGMQPAPSACEGVCIRRGMFSAASSVKLINLESPSAVQCVARGYLAWLRVGFNIRWAPA